MGQESGIGPKAESLRRLRDAGLPVPEARFLSIDAYREHAGRAGVPGLLESASAAPLDAAVVRAAIEAAPVDPSVRAELEAIHAELGGGPVAVRSSGSAEDMPQASFAGQHGTFFVSDGASLAGVVRQCWASLFSERAARYREHAGIPDEGLAMAVIIQRLVPAVCAGVVFTVDPIDGSDQVLVESCFGIGEALVSGRVTPDTLTFEREGLVLAHSTVGVKPLRIVARDDGRVTEEALSADEASAPSLDLATAREVTRLALEAERLFGVPVDVEWAFDGERVWLLQARPVTTLGKGTAGRPVLTVGHRPAAEGAPPAVPIVWSNANTGEILPDVATPMTWTIIHGNAQKVFGGLFDALGVHMDAQKSIGLVGGRIYFNLTILREAVEHFPALDPSLTLGGMQDYVDLPPTAAPGKPSKRAMLRAGIALPGYVASHSARRARRFLAGVNAENERAEALLAAEPGAEVCLALFDRLIAKFDGFNDALAFMIVGMIGYGVLQGVTKQWFGDENGSLANRLVSGRGGVESAEAGHALWELGVLASASPGVRAHVQDAGDWGEVRARLEATDGPDRVSAAAFLSAWDAFMRIHGHHRRGELEFANPTWAETPDYVLRVVRGYLARGEGDDPMAAYAARAAEADAAATECAGRLDPVRRAVFLRLLHWGRGGAAKRENVKSAVVKWLVMIRKALLALSDRLVEDGVLAHRDDVFFLRQDEVAAIVAGPQAQDWRVLTAARRAEHDRLSALTPPPVVIGEWDEDEASWQVRSDARVLKGMSASAGVARGPARVFLTADADETVLPGEILVAPFTDPGWTPYFVPAAGIVMDMGGMLSHGSIIAREYGIPAVVNVGPATRLITTGQVIEVDGDAGEVRIIG